MKKIVVTIFISFSLLAIACDNKAPQPIEEKNEIPTTNAPNFLQGNRYRYMARVDAEGIEQVELKIANKQANDKGRFMYGVYIEFIDPLHYKRYYTAPCGNDCFFDEVGKYYLPTADEIVLIMDSIEYSGMCSNSEPQYEDGEKKVYTLERLNNDSVVQLIRQDNIQF